MTYIYILRLEGNKYYVGKTNNPAFRLDQHFSKDGSTWTKLYKPIDVLIIIPNCDDYDEDKYTLKYMSIYGIDNVRGGSFCECELSIESKIFIQKMLLGSSNKCYECGSDKHFIENCSKSKSTKAQKHTVPIGKANQSKYKKLRKCGRCNRLGHDKRKCYAKTNKEGKIIL